MVEIKEQHQEDQQQQVDHGDVVLTDDAKCSGSETKMMMHLDVEPHNKNEEDAAEEDVVDPPSEPPSSSSENSDQPRNVNQEQILRGLDKLDDDVSSRWFTDAPRSVITTKDDDTTTEKSFVETKCRRDQSRKHIRLGSKRNGLLNNNKQTSCYLSYDEDEESDVVVDGTEEKGINTKTNIMDGQEDGDKEEHTTESSNSSNPNPLFNQKVSPEEEDGCALNNDEEEEAALSLSPDQEEETTTICVLEDSFAEDIEYMTSEDKLVLPLSEGGTKRSTEATVASEADISGTSSSASSAMFTQEDAKLLLQCYKDLAGYIFLGKPLQWT